MAFPYSNPSADSYVTSNYNFFRLKQSLSSAGDIFEVSQGGTSFVLGPDSDISQATVAYWDPDATPSWSSQASPKATYMSQFTITPQRPWLNTIPAVNNDAQYSPSKVPGRVLIWPTEIYDGEYLPPGFNASTDGLIREVPVIDIIQSFNGGVPQVPQRSDKTYQYETLPFKSANLCYLLIPFYGRRYASLAIQDLGSGGASKLNVQISGVNFRMDDGAPPLYFLATFNDNAGAGGSVVNARSLIVGSGYNQTLLPSTDTPPNLTITNANFNGGLFDYLLIEIAQGEVVAPPITQAAVRITVSDVPGRTGL